MKIILLKKYRYDNNVEMFLMKYKDFFPIAIAQA